MLPVSAGPEFSDNHDLQEAMMDSERRVTARIADPQVDSMDFRHLAAFQKVYQERSYSIAGQGTFFSRKSVVRMMQHLERDLECGLFTEGSRGELIPSPFAERLFNDLRFLNAARHRMKQHISMIHESGRVLHVGCSAAVFRTLEFRILFRELQSIEGIRACYSPVDSANAGKALVSGHCDLFIGCWSGKGTRFVTREAGVISYRIYRRGARPQPGEGTPGAFAVFLHNQIPEFLPLPGGHQTWEIMDESRWLYWLDHEAECPPGTLVLAPEVQVDPESWHSVEELPEVFQQLQVSFLRQHPYEFLPVLLQKIENRTWGA